MTADEFIRRRLSEENQEVILLGMKPQAFLYHNGTGTLHHVASGLKANDENAGWKHAADHASEFGFSDQEAEIFRDTATKRGKVYGRKYKHGIGAVMDAHDRFKKAFTRVWYLPAPEESDLEKRKQWHAGRDQLVLQGHQLDDHHVHRANHIVRMLADPDSPENQLDMHSGVHVIHRDHDGGSLSHTLGQLRQANSIEDVKRQDNQDLFRSTRRIP